MSIGQSVVRKEGRAKVTGQSRYVDDLVLPGMDGWELLKKLKLDPAASSAPFVATLVDVTGIIIYFTVAFIFLQGKLL